MSKVLVLGSGLAGSTAALAASQAGAEVHLISGPPGSTAAWSGRLDLFGPSQDPRGAGLPWYGPANTTPRALPRFSREDRLKALLQRRPHHPYATSGASLPELEKDLEEALSLLDAGLSMTPPSWMLTEAGTILPGDGGSTSTITTPDLTRCPIVWLDIPGASRYQGSHCAGLLASQLQRDAKDITVLEITPPQEAPAPYAAQNLWSLYLQKGPETCTALFRTITKALQNTPKDALIVLPPALGNTQESADAWIKALAEESKRHLVEAAALEEPVHGFRLWKNLQKRLQSACAKIHKGRIQNIHWRKEGQKLSIQSIQLTRKTLEPGALDAIVLATGRFVGGGIRNQMPLKENLFDLPIFIDGQMIDDPFLPPTRFTEVQPWQDHAIMTAGLATDHQSRPLDNTGSIFATNVFAAGHILGGTSPSLDGSAQGTSLFTGLRAGRAAAKQG